MIIARTEKIIIPIVIITAIHAKHTANLRVRNSTYIHLCVALKEFFKRRSRVDHTTTDEKRTVFAVKINHGCLHVLHAMFKCGLMTQLTVSFLTH